MVPNVPNKLATLETEFNNWSKATKAQYKYHTVISLHAKTIVTCVRIFWEVKAELFFLTS